VTTGKDAFVMVEAAIALAVAAIPEGLPIVATRVRTIMIFGPKADGRFSAVISSSWNACPNQSKPKLHGCPA